MTVPVGILAVLAVIGGWIQFAPLWTPVTMWLAPVARTLDIAEPTSWEEGISSALAVALGLAGVAVAWMLYAKRERAVPVVPTLQRALEHKFYFDELYDALFYRPSAAIAEWSRRGFEEPVVLAAGPELGDETQLVRRSTEQGGGPLHIPLVGQAVEPVPPHPVGIEPPRDRQQPGDPRQVAVERRVEAGDLR